MSIKYSITCDSDYLMTEMKHIVSEDNEVASGSSSTRSSSVRILRHGATLPRDDVDDDEDSHEASELDLEIINIFKNKQRRHSTTTNNETIC